MQDAHQPSDLWTYGMNSSYTNRSMWYGGSIGSSIFRSQPRQRHRCAVTSEGTRRTNTVLTSTRWRSSASIMRPNASATERTCSAGGHLQRPDYLRSILASTQGRDQRWRLQGMLVIT